VENISFLPYKLKIVFIQIITKDFFNNYRTVEGTHANIQKLVRYGRIKPVAEDALLDLYENYSGIKEDFFQFMTDLSLEMETVQSRRLALVG
jgi:hypothetical protein